MILPSRKLPTDCVKVIRRVLETAFEKSFFSFFRGYGHHQGQAYTLSRNHGHGEFGGCLAIQLWMRSSEAIFHCKSHKASLPVKPSANGLLEVSEANIGHPIVNQRVVMPEGGWYLILTLELLRQLTCNRAITDPRCVFTIEKGFVIIVVFATETLVDVWKTQMVFPDVPAVREKIKEMEDKRIGLNIKLEASR